MNDDQDIAQTSVRISAAALSIFGLYVVISHLVALTGHEGHTLLDAIAEVSRNFAVLLGLLSFILFGAIALGVFSAFPVHEVTAVTIAVSLMGFSYHFLYSDLSETHGLPIWQDELIHSGLTLFLLIWWVIFVPKADIQFVYLPIYLLLPLLYSIYAFGRGHVEGIYAYEFMDPRIDGGVTVFLNMIFLTCVNIVISIGFILLGVFANSRSG